jgi:hypothetical protein
MSTNLGRQAGRFQTIQTSNGSISGRGINTQSTKYAKVPIGLPAKAVVPATKTNVIAFPLYKSTQNGQLIRLRTANLRAGRNARAPKCSRDQPAIPIGARKANPYANRGEYDHA